MKTFNELKRLLKIEGVELKPEEQKEIRGGDYSTETACLADCNGQSGEWGYWSGGGMCQYNSYSQTWLCMDS